jgi:chromosome segregation protein
VATIQAQFDNLKKQARAKPQRYRRLAEQVRRAEALLFHTRWRAAEAEAERSTGELRAAERAVAEATESGLSQRCARESAEAALPPLRQADAAAGAELQRLTEARNSLEQELQRVLAARSDAEARSPEDNTRLAAACRLMVLGVADVRAPGRTLTLITRPGRVRFHSDRRDDDQLDESRRAARHLCRVCQEPRPQRDLARDAGRAGLSLARSGRRALQ